MTKQRVSWIDVARGIGIILVVYGHTLSAHSWRYLIYSFHMPLFFFLSGLVFTYREDEPPKKVLLKNARNLLYPYLIFALLSFAIWVVTRHPAPPELGKQFLSIFYGNGNNNLLIFNNILWFLPCLFLTRIGFYGLRKVIVDKRYLISVLVAFSVIGYLSSLFFSSWKLFFGLETALTAIVFFGAGHIWKTATAGPLSWARPQQWFVLFLGSGVCLLFAVLNYQATGLQVDMRVDRLNNYAYFYLAAFGGIAATLALSQLIQRNSILEYLGKKTLVLFAWHLLLFPYITRLLRVTGLRDLLSQLPQFVSPIVYTVTAIGIILVVVFLLDRILRILQGMRGPVLLLHGKQRNAAEEKNMK